MPVKKCSRKSAGAVIKKGGKILLINRAFFPLGWACPAGHVKLKEKPIDGARRETKEETNLSLVGPKLVLSKKRVKNRCVKGSSFHDWWVFEADCRGRLKFNRGEAKDAGWFSPPEIKKLKLEPTWRFWFNELKIL